VCQKCNAGDSHLGKGKKGYPNNDIALHGCATRYKYSIKHWTKDPGPQCVAFLKWVKKKGTGSAPDMGKLDTICPGVFDDSGDGSNDSNYQACLWGWWHGARCMGLGPLSKDLEEGADHGCRLRY